MLSLESAHQLDSPSSDCCTHFPLILGLMQSNVCDAEAMAPQVGACGGGAGARLRRLRGVAVGAARRILRSEHVAARSRQGWVPEQLFAVWVFLSDCERLCSKTYIHASCENV